MKEHLQAAISSLQALQENIEQYETLQDEIATSQAHLTSLKNAHEVIESKLANDRKLLDDKQHNALQVYEKSIYDKTLAIRELMEQIEAARTTLDGLRTAIAAAKAEYVSIQTSIDAIKKRFA